VNELYVGIPSAANFDSLQVCDSPVDVHISHALKRYYFCICYAWPLANSPVMAGNAFGETSSANRATLTRLSPLARDARETLYPAANGFRSSLHSLVGVSAFPAWCKEGFLFKGWMEQESAAVIQDVPRQG
jgi:hypothetical protein